MPLPRPTGSGALKILLLPQLLEHHIFYLITFSRYSIKPVLGFLLRVASVCYRSRYLDGLFLFVVVMRLREARLATARLIPAVLGAVSCNMSLLATHVAGDVCKVRSPTPRYESSPWWGYASPASSSSRYKRVVRLVLGSLSDTSTRSVRRRVHGIGVPRWNLESALASIGTSRRIFELI